MTVSNSCGIPFCSLGLPHACLFFGNVQPHACKGKEGAVEAVVEEKFKESGIRITGKGEISAEQIDKNMYIDTHYGAIASKAVKLTPSELNVPDKGKASFEKMFGETWDAAISAGKVYNAKDAAEKLGMDADGINKEWSKLTRGKDLIKFGGGFYCGKVKDIYVVSASNWQATFESPFLCKLVISSILIPTER